MTHIQPLLSRVQLTSSLAHCIYYAVTVAFMPWICVFPSKVIVVEQDSFTELHLSLNTSLEVYSHTFPEVVSQPPIQERHLINTDIYTNVHVVYYHTHFGFASNACNDHPPAQRWKLGNYMYVFGKKLTIGFTTCSQATKVGQGVNLRLVSTEKLVEPQVNLRPAFIEQWLLFKMVLYPLANCLYQSQHQEAKLWLNFLFNRIMWISKVTQRQDVLRTILGKLKFNPTP